MLQAFLALRPLEQAVLWRLLEHGPRFRPYDGEALRFYREQVTGRVAPQMLRRSVSRLVRHRWRLRPGSGPGSRRAERSPLQVNPSFSISLLTVAQQPAAPAKKPRA